MPGLRAAEVFVTSKYLSILCTIQSIFYNVYSSRIVSLVRGRLNDALSILLRCEKFDALNFINYFALLMRISFIVSLGFSLIICYDN